MRRTLITITALLALTLAACSSGAEPSTTTTAAAPATADVTVQLFAFDPAELTVPSGTTVTWSNQDRIDHTVTAGTPDAAGATFDLSLPDAGTTASFTFEEPGTFDYFCSIHPHMRGTVIVTG